MKRTASVLSLNFYPKNPVTNDIKKLAEELKVKTAIKEANEKAPTMLSKDEVYSQTLWALETVKLAKKCVKEQKRLDYEATDEIRNIEDAVKSSSDRLNDYGIIVTYSLAEYMNRHKILSFLPAKKSNKILEFLSPYMLEKASESLKQAMPEEYVKQYNINNAVKLLNDVRVKDYLQHYEEVNKKENVESSKQSTYLAKPYPYHDTLHEEGEVEFMGEGSKGS
ncbi:MAG TPA: hypothetical protein LFW21_00145 [Rickettsia endosymbiont of Pyrocoelia pectoralis]|nr:hypothetical protein [Rickettsia endosymbiont of Pyrocoelia pectoralis]